MPPSRFHPSATYEEALDRAALEWGIEPEYRDVWGRVHITSPDTKKAILTALGVPAGSIEQLDCALEQRLRAAWMRLTPVCLVLSQTQRPKRFPIRVTAELANACANIEIQLEQGGVERYALALGPLAVRESAEFDGHLYLRKEAQLPEDLPLGYHDVRIRIHMDGLSGWENRTRLIIAPDRVYEPPALAKGGRCAGVAINLYGVRSAWNWGCGDFRDLRAVVDWTVGQLGASFVALNPLHAIHNRRPFNTSPYLPNCVFYQNCIYLDVESIPDFQESARARRLFEDPCTRAEIEALRVSEYVEYERVYALKLRFLKLLFITFLRRWRLGGEQADAFRNYIEREGELLHRYATYCALDEYLHKRNPDLWIWPDWPEPFRDPESAETRAFTKKHWRSVLFYKYVQWQLDLQSAAAHQYAREKGLSIGLYHDLALATDRCGSDLWAHRAFYVSGCRVGSPPDDFSPKGQDWAFPPPVSDHHRESGYRLFIESIRKNGRHGGALRIDHVMRFFRLYWIPDGMDATRGAYVRDHAEDLLRILALESVRQKVVVVGEDLGTVDPLIREMLQRFGILSYRLLYFEKNADGSFRSAHEYPQQAVVSATTHDLPTLAGFWISADIQARHRAGILTDQDAYRAQLAERAREKQKLLDLLLQLRLLPDYVPRDASAIPELTGELHNAVIGFLASTPSQIMVINQEDLTKEIHQQNLPGTTSQYPNWSRKMKFSLEQLWNDRAAQDFTAMFRHWLERTDRVNQSSSM